MWYTYAAVNVVGQPQSVEHERSFEHRFFNLSLVPKSGEVFQSGITNDQRHLAKNNSDSM